MLSQVDVGPESGVSSLIDAQGKRWRLFLFLYFVSVIVGVGLLVTFVNYQEASKHERIQLSLAALSDVQTSHLNTSLSSMGDDLLFLSGLPSVLQFAETGVEADKNTLEEIFRNAISKKKYIAQIRILDAEGAEIVRLDSMDGAPKIYDDEDLQNKSQRYYFSEVITLPRGGLYISPLDLNVEHGQIQEPWNPMLRLATPLYTKTGTLSGVLVLNVLGKGLLKEFSYNPERLQKSMLLNESGYWLAGEENTKLWSFMFDGRENFARYYPDAWKSISANASGTYVSDNYIIVFQTIEPPKLLNSVAPILEVAEGAGAWKVVNFYNLEGRSLWERWVGKVVLAALLILLAVICWVWSGYLLEKRKAKRSSLVLQKMVSNADAIISVKDIDGAYIFVNQKFEELAGKVSSDIIGKKPEDIFDISFAQSDSENHRCVLQKKAPIRTEDTLVTDFKNLSLLTVHFPLESEDGRIRSVTSISTDITELKHTQERLAAEKDKAEQASYAKSAFLANMSHELRTPLNAIIGYSEMLLEDLEDDPASKMAPDIKRIFGAGKHLLALVNDILDISKIEAGKMELSVAEVNFDSLVDEVVLTAEGLAKKNNNTLVVKYDGDQIGAVKTDSLKLRQIILNLLSNASKFCTEGTILFTVGQSPGNPSNWLRLSVKDTGIGIPPDQLECLFDEFTQADSSLSRKYGGTGLGLAISKRFVEMMGGTIGVESTEGEGSVFTVKIPLMLNTEPVQIMENTVLLPASKEMENRILVIDDDRASQEILTRYLTREGYQVATVSTGAEGIKLAEKLMPDAILLDVIMPDITGWEILSLLKSNNDTKDIPTFMCTIVDDRKKGITLGAVDYLTKPINRDALVMALRRHLNIAEDPYVLVVEDDVDARDLVVRYTRELGSDSVVAGNGVEAFDRIREFGKPDLILLDLMMPEMDGFEFLRILRTMPSNIDIPVIVVTAKSLTEQERAYLSEQTIAIVQKGAENLQVVLQNMHKQLSLALH
ncbi:response regulator [Kordiimonas pumila]|uniref:histidine kinase n=1 Tax=Kordiimonas pumila TaxID=2161677 RepID=A0ABV7D4W8_9PROT|nr:response regulator [Kordiimonas pumila]